MPNPRRAQFVAACIGLIAIEQVAAQNVCNAPLAAFEPNPETLAGNLEVSFASAVNDGSDVTRLFGDVELRYLGFRLQAEQANFIQGSRFELPGATLFESEGVRISAESGEFDWRSEALQFTGAELNVSQQELTARARADSISLTSTDVIELRGLSITTCPEDQEAWKLLGRSLTIDQVAGLGVVRGATLRLFNVPVLRAPYFSFPLDDRRKTGFLTPEFAERDRTGFDLTVPYYLNLAPNHDLLLEPRLMEDRGTQLAARYRYLLPGTSGQLRTEYIENDHLLDRSRYFITLNHETAFGERVALDASYENVSDPAYFEDLGDSLGVMSQINLDRYVRLAYYAPRWSLASRLQEYQTLAIGIDPADFPHERVPQLQFSGTWGDRLLGFESTAEAVQFDRPIGANGWRLDTSQEISLRLLRAGAWLTPAIGFRQTNYRIDATPGNPERTFSRGLPVTSIDAGLRFERIAGPNQSRIQTIEPRLLLVRIPYEDQSELPVFDTILPDFNLIQLFNKYQFTGPDRIADTNRVSFGLTTRLLGASGRERLSATIGQTRYRDPRRIMLPNEDRNDSTRSNYVAELEISLNEKLSLDIGHQWNGETGDTVRARTRLEFRPTAEHLFGIGYRKREDLLEQGDFSLVWPVADRWRLIGQYSYSFLDNKPLERFAGIEYEACCWRLQVTTHRYIVRSTGQTDNTISIKFELKGLANGRETPDELLQRGILGGSTPNR